LTDVTKNVTLNRNTQNSFGLSAFSVTAVRTSGYAVLNGYANEVVRWNGDAQDTLVKLINYNTRLMSKEDCIEVTGTVVEKFPSGLFSVQLDQERTVLAHLAGKLRRNRIRVLAGDRVTLELSPYDLTKGRITYRHK
jgi:translation initiation factor IF-1